jgi:hypothetical protein
MRPISDTNRSINYGETSWEDGDFTASSTGSFRTKNLIRTANSVPITKVFELYGIKASEHNRKIICPFNHHKGGKENTPSFIYYPNTNTFYCFGCNSGSSVVDFVAFMDHVNKYDAALKIIEIYCSDITENEIINSSLEERNIILFEFSNFIRNYLEMYSDNPECFSLIEKHLLAFDRSNEKYYLDTEALKFLTDKVKKRIESYLCL